ncbi:MAG: efflux RND transporter permease subunit [Bacteroidales bacterium]
MKKLPAFSVILIFVVLMIIGAGVIPLLNIQYTPSKKGSEVEVNYSWAGASAKLIEMEVTSKLEGLIASVSGIKKISSVSQKSGGSITIELKDKDEVEHVRFEIAQLIRQIYKKLPEGCSYPSLSVAASGTNVQPIIIFTVNANIPTQDIENYTQEHIVKELALIKGISSVNLSGATPYYREVCFDPKKLASFGISIGEFRNAIMGSLSDYDIVGSINETGILLKHNTDPEKLEEIPIKNMNGRVIRVGDLSKVEKKERVPSGYYRINGLNTINITVYPEKFVNTLDLCAAVKAKMKVLETSFPDKFAVIVSYDSSITLKEELDKIVFRTILSLIILLLFVFIVSRSLRYLFIITLSLAANILIAFIFYVVYDMEIHLYSLAGITVSLGIIIDTSIIMISHYGYYKNRNVFIAILAAQMTSIGALVVVFLLPEQQRANLVDFSGVIIINLVISLLISMLLIPALVDTIGVKKGDLNSNTSYKGRRRVIKFNNFYGKYIYYAKKYKWATFVIIILGFGLPIGKLPDKLGLEAKQSLYSSYKEAEIKNKDKKDNIAIKLYNKTFGTDFFKNKVKERADKVLGGSIRLFLKNYGSGGYYREPARPSLSIMASLPDGCTVAQLNEIVLSMENFLSQFEEIESFKTSIYSHSNGTITVNFKKEIENTYFPLMLKQQIISKAINFGGANWAVYGIDEQGFNNNIYSGYKSQRIEFTGYNYDQLYDYCKKCVAELSKNARVSGPDIFGKVGWGNTISRSEYFIDYDPYKLAKDSLSLQDAFTALQEQIYSQRLGSYYEDGGKNMYVDAVSNRKEYFDVWYLNNEYIKVGGKDMRFSDIGKVEKRSSGNDIYREDQQYSLIVAYDFVGPYELANRVLKREIERLNEVVLPIGYKASQSQWSYWGEESQSIWLLLIIIGIIYFICAVLFESLRAPLIIIGLIPVSFIGVFLIFAITGCKFDQGGYASLVMLSGIVVNAGIYILNELNGQRESKKYLNFYTFYLRSFNHKILPILLTVLSTVLGLIPFLMDGESEVFWFAFALGTMGGLCFSLIALILFMPVWVPMSGKK